MENIAFGILIAVVFILIFIIILFFIKLVRIEKKYNEFIVKFDNKESIENTLKNYISMVNTVNEENKIINANYVNLERQLEKCIQKIGIVRYNAFDDVGSDLSFALAILDNDNNGIVLNAIYARTSSNIYAKPIENGSSKYTLSEEEIKAVSEAKKAGEKI